MSHAERRAFARVQVGLAVRYTAEDGFERDGRIENISRGGVLLVLGAGTAGVGTTLRINVPDGNGVDRILVGQVVRSSPDGLAGVTFLEVDDATLDYVEQVLANA